MEYLLIVTKHELNSYQFNKIKQSLRISNRISIKSKSQKTSPLYTASMIFEIIINKQLARRALIISSSGKTQLQRDN